MQFGILYLIIMNLIGFILMGVDKKRAIKHGKTGAYVRRIPEKTLFLSCILGGSAGVWAGMYVFRHKTRHWYFVVGVPLILLVQMGMLFGVYRLGLYDS